MIFYEKKVKMGLTGFTHSPQRDVAQVNPRSLRSE